jgi:hypothetical protein
MAASVWSRICGRQPLAGSNGFLRQGRPQRCGGSAEIVPATAELRLGKIIVKNPGANFFMEGSPAGEGQAGHIGVGILEKYRVTLDYSRLRMILEPPATETE